MNTAKAPYISALSIVIGYTATRCTSHWISPVVADWTIKTLRRPRKGKRGEWQKVVSPSSSMWLGL